MRGGGGALAFEQVVNGGGQRGRIVRQQRGRGAEVQAGALRGQQLGVDPVAQQHVRETEVARLVGRLHDAGGDGLGQVLVYGIGAVAGDRRQLARGEVSAQDGS